MLSIIVCSRNKEIDPEFEKNIQDTIGMSYEIIWIDNSKNEYSIFSAYNRGVDLAKGDILCFAHEDIVFHSSDWGNILNKVFCDNQNGVVGVYGSQVAVKGRDVRVWSPYCSGQLIQGFTSLYDPMRYIPVIMGDCTTFNPVPTEVVAVDGLFMAIPKRLFDSGELRFDTDTFNGFHGYDWDICFQAIAAKKRVLAAHDIIIEHKSQGAFNDAFSLASSKLSEKWDYMLPLTKGLNPKESMECEHKIKAHENSSLLIDKLIEYNNTRVEIGNILSASGADSLSRSMRKFLSKQEYKLRKAYLKEGIIPMNDAYKEIKDYCFNGNYFLIFKLKLLKRFIEYSIKHYIR